MENVHVEGDARVAAAGRHDLIASQVRPGVEDLIAGHG